MAKDQWWIRNVGQTTQNIIAGYARTKGIEIKDVMDKLASLIEEDGFNVLDLDEDTKRRYKVYAAQQGLKLNAALAKIIETVEQVEGSK